MARSVVVFPAPLAPTRVTISPLRTDERDPVDSLHVPVEDIDGL
jgi:hypothetical protein